MLDQSFSIENFRKIFEIENRKGRFESRYYSDEFHELSNELKRHRQVIKEYKASGEILPDDEHLKVLFEEKKEIEQKKNNELETILHEIVSVINRKSFRFNFTKLLHHDSGKFIYPLSKDAASFFAMKQLQYNLNRTFNVKQGNRYLITKQVQLLLKDNFPKIVLRTDIKGFYESVPQKKLLGLIHNNQLLSPKSKKLIDSLIYRYNELTEQIHLPIEERKGIPRGAGISAYLAELYMRDVDNNIRRIEKVSYYERYVDDIIIFFIPDWKMNLNDYELMVEKIIRDNGLMMNPAKTFPYDLQNSNSLKEIEYLGYVFRLNNLKYECTLLSNNKKEKYITRIKKVLDIFLEQKTYAPKEASKLLIHRISYLTKNTRLHKPKKGLVGIYYSNSLIEDDCTDLSFLDSELQRLIDEKLPIGIYPGLNKKLKGYSFRDGFVNRLFFNINSRKKNIADLRPDRLKEIKKLDNNFERVISIWK